MNCLRYKSEEKPENWKKLNKVENNFHEKNFFKIISGNGFKLIK